MQRNVKLFPIYKMFSYDILFYYAISILFLTTVKNFTLSQVALISTIYSIAAVSFQVPASIIADKIGLRNSMIIGNISCMLWALVYIVVPSFISAVIAELFCGFGFALKGVSETPFIYTTLKKLGQTSEFSKIESKGSSFYFIIEAIACVAAGYLFSINHYLPIIFSTIMFLAATILAFYMTPVPAVTDSKQTIKERVNDITSGFKFIFRSKRLHALLIFALLFYGIISMSNLYIKAFFNGIDVPSQTFGYIFAFAAISSALGALVQGKIEKKHRNKTLSTVSIAYLSCLTLLGIVAMIFKNYNILLFAGICVFLIISLIKGAYRIIMKEYISRYTTSSIRSKLMSVYYLAENLGSATITFIVSRAIDFVPLGTIMTVSGLILFVLLILVLNYMNTRVGLSPEKYTKRDRADLQ